MKQSRKNIILEEIKNEPENPFNYYLLALELKREGNKKEALQEFDYLINNFPDYLPVYQTYILYLIELAIEDEKLIQLINSGINLAISQNNKKAQSELQAIFDIYC
ncbi:MAG: hypothetical protein RJA76_718 [Bacteroidota bacterium]|jgi:tetratricopeptide (TPR) repeat protein